MSVDFTKGIIPQTVEAVPQYLEELGYRLEEAFANFALTQLEDVDLLTTLPGDGDTLVFDLASGLWLPGAGGGGGPGGADTEVQYNNASAFGGITAGASGTVLTSNGVGVVPSYQAAGGGGVAATPTPAVGELAYWDSTGATIAGDPLLTWGLTNGIFHIEDATVPILELESQSSGNQQVIRFNDSGGQDAFIQHSSSGHALNFVQRTPALADDAASIQIRQQAADFRGELRFFAGGSNGVPAVQALSINGLISVGTDEALFDYRVVTSASTTSRAGFNMAEGVAPSSPIDGDIWPTAAGALNARLNGVTIDLASGAVAGSNTEIQFNNSGAHGADPDFTVTGLGGASPRVRLGGETVARFPAFEVDYDTSDEGAYWFYEAGTFKGGMQYHASIAGDSDVLRLINRVNGGAETNSTVHIGADNAIKIRVSEDGCRFTNSLQMNEESAPSHSDLAGFGQLWNDNSGDGGRLTWRNDNGVDFPLTGSAATIAGATTTELEDATDAINTDAAKVLGYMVKNVTTGVHVFASGNGDTSVWHFYDESTAHTPV